MKKDTRSGRLLAVRVMEERRRSSGLPSTPPRFQRLAGPAGNKISRLRCDLRDRDKRLEATTDQLFEYARSLNVAVGDLRLRNRELFRAQIDTIRRLALAAEFKDENIGNHLERVSRYSRLLARGVGLASKAADLLYHAAPMHDVGKIGIPDNILFKSGNLSDAEFTAIKTHTTIGAQILADSESEIIRAAREIALTHHERWDGSGYPQGLAGKNIPLYGRIVALVDAFDAFTSRRPYKDPYPFSVACDIVLHDRGRHFDPQLVDAFMDSLDEIRTIMEECCQGDSQETSSFAWSQRDREAATAGNVLTGC